MTVGTAGPERLLPIIPIQTSELLAEAHDECGFVAVATQANNAAEVATIGITELQNRGKETTGVAVETLDHGTINHKDFGTGDTVFPDGGKVFNERHPGHFAVAHARYGTQGSRDIVSAQPYGSGMLLYGKDKHAEITIVHNGNITNCHDLKNKTSMNDQNMTDSAVVHTLFAQNMQTRLLESNDGTYDLVELVRTTLPELRGAFSGAVMSGEQIVAFTDPNGLKPSVVGRLPDGGVIVASEVTALDANNAELLFEMNPGELVSVDGEMNIDGAYAIHREQWTEPNPKGCLLEIAYILKEMGRLGTEAVFRGVNVGYTRRAFGRELAKVAPVLAHMVVGVPNSAVTAGLGYAEASGIPYRQALEAVSDDRSFISPTTEARQAVVRAKIRANPEELAGKMVVAVEDSLIRGTTMKEVVSIMRDAGATAVHVRIALDRYLYICNLGVDTGSQDELIAAKMSDEEIAHYINADSVAFLPVEGIRQALGEAAGRFCMGCLTSTYPIEAYSPEADLAKEQELISA